MTISEFLTELNHPAVWVALGVTVFFTAFLYYAEWRNERDRKNAEKQD